MKNLEIMQRRLGNSGLTGTPFDAPDEVVRRHGAMQAQDYGPAKWSVAQRAPSLLDGDFDDALAAGSILRTHVLRPTWHFVTSDDIRWLLALTGPRVRQHNRPRYRQLGLDDRTLGRCEALIVSALEGGNSLTRNAIAGVLDDAGIDRSGQRLPHILMHCELGAAICSGPLEGKQQTYALLDERVPNHNRFDRDQSLTELARRYLTSHGPAAVQDLRWWSSLTVADINATLYTLGSEVQQETIDDVTFWSMDSDASHPPSRSGAHLLQTYDELIVGYTATRYFGDPLAAAARAAWKDRSLPNGVVLLNRGIAGHWKRSIDRDSVGVEVRLYKDLKRGEAQAVETAAGDLGRFLERRVTMEVTCL